MNSFIGLFVFVLCCSTTFADQQCSEKISDIKTNVAYDTKLNTETAYTVEFKSNCPKNAQFFAVLDGNVLTSSGSESGDFQFSWTESHKAARTGEIKLRVFDEEGFVAYKKAQRNNEDLTKVKELQEISFYHKGSFKGISIQTEIVVIVLACLVFYFAQDQRSKIQA